MIGQIVADGRPGYVPCLPYKKIHPLQPWFVDGYEQQLDGQILLAFMGFLSVNGS
jgi:hypothetical protein